MIKRLFDLVLTLLVGLVFLPVIIVLAIVISSVIGNPIVFKQLRPSLHSKPFSIYKFRTMNNHNNNKGELLPDVERLTALGRWLRSTSLDELPSLWNVLKGEMSLVGPRPLLMEYLPLYNAEQTRRHQLKPGVTGWAQVNGRNAISWEDKFKLDVWYVDNQSLYLDIKIILMTIKKVLCRADINANGEATMPKFTGNTD